MEAIQIRSYLMKDLVGIETINLDSRNTRRVSFRMKILDYIGIYISETSVKTPS